MKEWYIIIEGKQEGPYGVADLRRDERITPETLVWKQGFEKWVPLRTIPELKTVFHDLGKEKEKVEEDKVTLPENDTLTLATEPPYFYFWIIITLISITYALYQYFTARQ